MKNLALIIGNANYPDSPLKNPINDANSVEEKLSWLGFKTIKQTNATDKEMEEGVNKFSDLLTSCEVALFFFAGHGMQINGENYLTAVNTNFDREIDAKYSSLPLNKVIETMESGTNQTDIIMLDACRNNPYERKWRGVDSRGLAPVYTPKGMIIGYATSPGQVAYDGDGDNGSYTDAFLKHVVTPDITIEDLFKRVRNTLSSSTKGRQISWEHTSLMGDFYFNYSLETDDKVPSYNDDALADTNFSPSSSDTVREIIDGLKSHNWYVQNPTFSKINQANLEEFSKDELFILGRNIYQAACGTAQSAMEYLDNLQQNISRLDEGIRFHLLNGILFEIYFDSKGKYRVEAKSEMIDPIFRLENSEICDDSFKYLKQILKPYHKNLFYIPSFTKNISVDISCIDYEEDKKAIESVFFESDNVLYDEDGSNYFDPFEYGYLRRKSRADIKENIANAMVVPKSKLTVNYVNLKDHEDEILCPYDLNIKKL